MKITIYGAGVFGTSLGQILERNGHEVLYYAPKNGISQKSALKFPEIIVLAVPSDAVKKVVKKLPKEKPLIVATKGILSLAPFKNQKVAFLSGGAFAAELDAHQKTILTATDSLIPELFETSWLKFELTPDRLGVILCGALKNIYAIYAGLQNVAASPEKTADLIKRTAAEMREILKLNGADPKTVDLACGLGDLKTTFSPSSRNYRFGQKLSQNPNFLPSETTEGLTAIRALPKTAIKIPASLPILENILELLETQ